ncbi:hypothetical protein, partial [Segatella maculosa]|uniref:hypothetical protein n=1 Tax=Segatella maculosa TaxID=439703 RepID=UPI0036F40E20
PIFIYHALFIIAIARKLGLPSLGRGWGWAFSPPSEGSGEAFGRAFFLLLFWPFEVFIVISRLQSVQCVID